MLNSDVVFLGIHPAGTQRNDGSLSMPRLAASFPAWISQCAAAAKIPGNIFPKSATLGQNWSLGLVGYSMGNVLLGPNPKYPNCSANGAGTLQSPGMFGLSSYHPGGAHILMSDGAVRFLKDSVNMETVWKLGSRAGGEVLSSDEY